MIATGIQRNDDFKGGEQVGAGLYQVTQSRGQRWTTADGYLTPAKKRSNLKVLVPFGPDGVNQFVESVALLAEAADRGLRGAGSGMP